jgi:hypothetical protein
VETIARENLDFARDGILRVPGAFCRDDAARMQAVIWAELRTRHGIERDDRSTWRPGAPTGMKTSKRSRAFAPICGPSVATALDGLLGAGRWVRPQQFGNVLVTFPDAREWRVPDRVWHSDFEATLTPDQLTVVKLWALCDDVEPGQGGTPQLAGSHRLFARYLETATSRAYKDVKFGFLASHPWLRELTDDDGAPDRNERFLGGTEIEGLPVRVVELTGAAGDVFLTHPWVFHSIPVNAGDRPRMLRSCAMHVRLQPERATVSSETRTCSSLAE